MSVHPDRLIEAAWKYDPDVSSLDDLRALLLETAAHLLRSRSLDGPIALELAPRDIDEARQCMVHDLHTAVYGHTGARPETPAFVWRELLDKVTAWRERSEATRSDNPQVGGAS